MPLVIIGNDTPIIWAINSIIPILFSNLINILFLVLLKGLY